jgi:hypothetical protein
VLDLTLGAANNRFLIFVAYGQRANGELHYWFLTANSLSRPTTRSTSSNVIP